MKIGNWFETIKYPGVFDITVEIKGNTICFDRYKKQLYLYATFPKLIYLSWGISLPNK